MSMLSAQIDELRKAAEYYDSSEVANIMRYAADTIWQLRDNLQRTNTDNARLQEMVTDDELHMQQMQDENIRLRELARDALRPKHDKSMRMTPAQWREYDADVLRRARELEVDW